jgi:hypothetical protein
MVMNTESFKYEVSEVRNMFENIFEIGIANYVMKKCCVQNDEKKSYSKVRFSVVDSIFFFPFFDPVMTSFRIRIRIRIRHAF